VPEPGRAGTKGDSAIPEQPALQRSGGAGRPDLGIGDSEWLGVAPAPDHHGDLGGRGRKVEAAAERGGAQAPAPGTLGLRGRPGEPVPVRIHGCPGQPRYAGEVDLGAVRPEKDESEGREVLHLRGGLAGRADHACAELIPASGSQTREREDDPRPAIPIADDVVRPDDLQGRGIRPRGGGRQSVSFAHRISQIKPRRGRAVESDSETKCRAGQVSHKSGHKTFWHNLI
jgi:hypothetical protein